MLFGFISMWQPLVTQLVVPLEKRLEGFSSIKTQCRTAVGNWDEALSSFDRARILNSEEEFVDVPIPANYLSKADLGEFKRYVCTFNIGASGNSQESGWLFLPIVYGESAFYIDGKFRGYLPDMGSIKLPISAEERNSRIGLDIVSRRIAKDYNQVGLVANSPIFYSGDSESSRAVIFDQFKSIGAVEKGRISIFLPLVLMLAWAWISGMRFNDIGWILLLMASLCLQSVVILGPDLLLVDFWWRCYQFFFLAGAVAYLGFSLAFLQSQKTEALVRKWALPGLLSSIAGFYLFEKLYWHTRTYFVPAISTILVCALTIALIVAAKKAKASHGRRRLDLTAFAVVSLLGACGYALQATGYVYFKGAFGPFIQPAVTLAFGVFLGADLVMFQRRTLSERQIRFGLEGRNQVIFEQMTIGQSIQNLLLKPTGTIDLESVKCVYSYKPHIHLAGDWVSIWESDEGLCVIAGDVSGKGAPASLAMAMIMGFMERVREGRLALSAALEGVNRAARENLKGNLMSTWTGLVVTKSSDLLLGSAGSVGWFVWDGSTVKLHATRSDLIGINGEMKNGFKKIESKDWKIAITVSDGLCATGRGMKVVSEQLKPLLEAGSTDSKIMEMLYGLAANVDIPDDQSVIIVRQKYPS